MYRITFTLILSLIFLMSCSEEPLSAESELTEENFSHVDENHPININNRTGVTVTFRNIFTDYIESEDISHSGAFEIRSNKVEIITYNQEPLQFDFNGLQVESIQYYFNQKIDGETVNITRLLIDNHKNDIRHKTHIDANIQHPDGDDQ